ncbi:MAG: ATP-binding cassette domain-containing protein [Burkholderiales bacterium]|nr:ATP-binding cassette domain-containing protein [Burkholderiales bacterium]
MIRLQSLTLSRGVKPLFESADLTLNPGEHVGLIGANGSGKSTLFALLLGQLNLDGGEVGMPPRWRLAHVAQETPALERAALDYVIDGDNGLRALEAELAALEAQDHAHDDHAHGTRIAELHALLADAGAYTVRSRAEQLLTGLGFSAAQMGAPVAEFSGGWRMRLNLAQALMCPSDLLLLDEPTNHLDLDAILWLEDWLKGYPGTLIIISHDRDFLDGVIGVIAHIDQRKIRRYAGNYSQFEVQRAMALTLNQAAYEKQQRERAHLQSFIDRFKAKATKARQAQSRMKMLARMGEMAPIHAASPFSFEFREPIATPNPLLVLEDAVAGYALEAGHKPVVSGIGFTLTGGQRIGLLGVNGAGKSTLIKTIAGELPLIDGVARFGKGLAIGYFAQHQVEMLRHDESPLWHMARLSPNVREQELRNFLGGFNFPGEMVTQSIAPFSGGEKARLALALIAWQRPNLLLLDEPTNHLDLETREALTVALAQFEGTLVLVSHDRHLLRATTEEFMIVAGGALTPFDGDLEDYRDWLFRTRLGKPELNAPKVPPATTNIAPRPPKAAASAERPSGMANAASRQEQKRRDAQERQRRSDQLRPLTTRIKRLEEQLAKLNTQRAAVDASLATESIYAEERRDELKNLMIDKAYLAREIEELETEWLEKQTELEALQGA